MKELSSTLTVLAAGFCFGVLPLALRQLSFGGHRDFAGTAASTAPASMWNFLQCDSDVMTNIERRSLELILSSDLDSGNEALNLLSNHEIGLKDFGDIAFYLLCRKPAALIAWNAPLSEEETISAISHFTAVHYDVLGERAKALDSDNRLIAQALWSVFGDQLVVVFDHALRIALQVKFNIRDLLYCALVSENIPLDIRIRIGALAIHYNQSNALEISEILQIGCFDTYTANTAHRNTILKPQVGDHDELHAALAAYDLRDFALSDVELTGNLALDADHLRIVAAQKLYQTGHFAPPGLSDAKLNASVLLSTLDQFASSMPEEAFQKALEEGQISGRWTFAYQVMRTWLNSNMLEASAHIEKIPSTPERDRLSAYVAKTSATYGDYEAAWRWLEFVSSTEVQYDTTRYINEVLEARDSSNKR